MTGTEAERAAQEWRKNHCGEQYKAERRGTWTGGCPSVLVKDAYLAGWAAARRWIPCSERMPDYLVPVMLWDGGECWYGHREVAGMLVYYFGNELKTSKEFTHWMPLPDPPKREK